MRWIVVMASVALSACPSTLAMCSDGCPVGTVCDVPTGICVRPDAVDSGSIALDAGQVDAGAPDAGASDAGVDDAGTPDAGAAPDAGPVDAGPVDAGLSDAGATDAGSPDAGSPDAGAPDAGRVVLPNQASIASGGRATSAAYRMDATIGAQVSGQATSGTYKLTMEGQ